LPDEYRRKTGAVKDVVATATRMPLLGLATSLLMSDRGRIYLLSRPGPGVDTVSHSQIPGLASTGAGLPSLAGTSKLTMSIRVIKSPNIPEYLAVLIFAIPPELLEDAISCIRFTKLHQTAKEDASRLLVILSD